LWNFALTTVAGTGETGFNREEGTATKVMLHEPWGMFFDDEIREFSTSVTHYESQTIRVSVSEAAHNLGIEPASVKKRVQRGKLRSEKAESGTLYVYLDRSETVQDRSQGRSETGTDLVAELRDRIAYLERQVEEEREARRRADPLLARALDQLPALEPAQEDAQRPSEAAQAPASDQAGGSR
jgi:hypothetical protein